MVSCTSPRMSPPSSLGASWSSMAVPPPSKQPQQGAREREDGSRRPHPDPLSSPLRQRRDLTSSLGGLRGRLSTSIGGRSMPTAQVHGAEIYYEEAGSGPPLILSPGGLQGVLASYQPVRAKLAQVHRVIVYDRRFGGQSNSPLVVQTWDMVCQDVIDLMDALGIERAYLGGGSFGAAISFGCAVRYPERVRAIVPSNLAGGVICTGYLAMKLFRSAEMAMAQGIKAVIDAFDPDDRFAPFTPERAQYDAMYRKTLEEMPPADFAQVMRDTIYALFDGPYLTLGMSEKRLKAIRTPTLMMPGNNDIHPRSVAE